MVAYCYVNLGTAGTYAQLPGQLQWVGTDGLVTCLGVYCQVADQGVFVGHAACDVSVSGPGAAFDYVRDAMADLMTGALGAYDPEAQTNLQLFSGGTDQALAALRAGVAQWAGGNAPTFTGQDSFRVKPDGTGLTFVRSSDTPTAVDGPDAFTVPDFIPEPGPVIPPNG